MMIWLFVAYFLLATAITSNKIILFALSPEFLVGIRMTIAALLLGGYSFIYAHHRVSCDRVRQYFPSLIVIALFTTFFPSVLKAYSLAHMPSSKMAFFGTLDPFVAAFYSYALYGESLTPRKWLGVVIGFAGMLILIFSSSPLEEQLKAFSIISYPELAAFLAIVLSRFGWILAQQFLKKDIFGPVQINIITMALGGIVSLVAAFTTGQTSITSLSQAPVTVLKQTPLALLPPDAQLGGLLAYTIIVGNMLGYTLYASMLKLYSATMIALAGFSIPLFVHLFGYLFLNEPLSLVFFIACVVTFVGLVIFFLDENKRDYKKN